MSGTYAYTGIEVTLTFAATLKLSGMEGWSKASNWPYGFAPYCRITMASGTASLQGYCEQEPPGFPAPPDPTDINLGVLEGALCSPGGAEDTNAVYYGLATWDSVAPEPWIVTFDDPDDHSASASIQITHLRLYKRRVLNADRIPPSASGPSDACHAVHWDMEYAWASTASSEITVTCGSATATESYSTGGYIKDLPGAAVFIGLAESAGDGFNMPTTMPAAEGARVTVTNYSALNSSGSFELDYDYSNTQITVDGTGSVLTLTTNAVSPPSLPMTIPDSLLRYPDVWVALDLQIDNWAENYAGLKWVLPTAPEGTPTEAVATDVSATRVYKDATWWSGRSRPFTWTYNLNTTELSSNDELVTPADVQAEVEESGLDTPIPAAGYTWGHFKVRRSPSVSVHAPPGVAVAPSAWVLDGTTLARALVDNYPWLLSTAAGEGYDTVTPPQNYEWLRHFTDAEAATLGTDPSDVCNWSNYGFLRLTYTSGAVQSVGLAVTNRTYTITDPHITGGGRKTGFSSSYVETVHQLGPVSLASGAGLMVIIDLQSLSDRLLQHVVNVAWTGLTSTLTVTDLELLAYNPTTAVAGVGRCDLLASYRRVDPSSELPVDYVGYRGTADGARAIVAPDETEDRTGEMGLRCVERLRGAGTGLILDHLVELDAVATNLQHQEGIEVDGFASSPQPWETSATAYTDSFVDADSNDMLGGLLACDIAELYDGVLSTHASTLTELLTRPRVGRQLVVSGYGMGAVCRKVLRGNLHTLVRDGATRANAVECKLWEVDGAGGTPATLETADTDDWGRIYFGGMGGFREERWGKIVATALGTPDATSVTSWFIVRNRGREWVGAVLTAAPPGERIHMVTTSWGTYVAAHHSDVLLPGQAAPAADCTLLEIMDRNAPNSPARTVEATELRHVSVTYCLFGRLYVYGHSGNDCKVLEFGAGGDGERLMATISDLVDVTAVVSPTTKIHWVIGRQPSDDHAVVYRGERATGPGDLAYTLAKDFGVADTVGHGISAHEDGSVVARVVVSGIAYDHVTRNNGTDWS